MKRILAALIVLSFCTREEIFWAVVMAIIAIAIYLK